MSLELNSMRNLKRPGLTGSFGSSKRTVGTSSQATKNLANSSAASKTTHFSFKSSNKYNWVAGQNVSKGQNRYNYQGMRASLNSRTFTPSVGYSGPTTYGTTTYTVNNNNAYMKGQIIGQVLNGTFSLLNQLGVFDGLKNDSSTTPTATQQLNDFVSANQNISSTSGVSGYISNMESATDSMSLRSALADASGQLSSLNAQTNIYTSLSQEASKAVDGLEESVSDAKDDVSEKKNLVGQLNTTVTARERSRDNAINSVRSLDSSYAESLEKYSQAHDARVTAESNYSNAQAATGRAQTSFNQAEATFRSTPEQIPDANGNLVPNPKYQQAKIAYENAKTQLDKAKEAEEQAKEKLDQAKTNENDALKAKEDAFNKLGDAKEAVKQAEAEVTKAQEQLDNTKKSQSEAQNNYNIATESYQTAIRMQESNDSILEQCKNHTKMVKELSESIDKQQKRLTKLEAEEEKKYDKYDDKVQKGIEKNQERNNKIGDTVDGFRDKWLSNKMEKTNAKVEENIQNRNQYSQSVKESDFIKSKLESASADFTLGGQKFRKIDTPSGQQVYYKDNLVISAEEYERAQKAAGVSA